MTSCGPDTGSVWSKHVSRRGRSSGKRAVHSAVLRAAILTSFMATCQHHKIAPVAYLRDVLGRVAQHSLTKLDELLPANRTTATD
jgi:IS66 C-terminal element